MTSFPSIQSATLGGVLGQPEALQKHEPSGGDIAGSASAGASEVDALTSEVARMHLEAGKEQQEEAVLPSTKALHVSLYFDDSRVVRAPEERSLFHSLAAQLIKKYGSLEALGVACGALIKAQVAQVYFNGILQVRERFQALQEFESKTLEIKSLRDEFLTAHYNGDREKQRRIVNIFIDKELVDLGSEDEGLSANETLLTILDVVGRTILYRQREHLHKEGKEFLTRELDKIDCDADDPSFPGQVAAFEITVSRQLDLDPAELFNVLTMNPQELVDSTRDYFESRSMLEYAMSKAGASTHITIAHQAVNGISLAPLTELLLQYPRICSVSSVSQVIRLPSNFHQLKGFYVRRLLRLPHGSVNLQRELCFSDKFRADSLQVMQLEHVKVKEMPAAALPSLRKLDISSCVVVGGFPSGFFAPALGSLTVDGFDIKNIPTGEAMPKLTTLSLANIDIHVLAEGGFNAPHLEDLKVIRVPLMRLPRGYCPQLRRLHLHNTRLQEIPQEFEMPVRVDFSGDAEQADGFNEYTMSTRDQINAELNA